MKEEKQLKFKRKVKPASPKVARNLTRLRFKCPDASPEEILEKIENRFIKSFSVAGGSRGIADAILLLLPESARKKMGDNPGSVINNGTDRVSRLSTKKLAEQYILSVALIYGLNPRNAAQVFQEILDKEISEFIEQAKKGSEQTKGGVNTTVFLATLGFIPQLKPYKKYLGKVAAVLVGGIGFMGAQGIQREFAEQLVDQVRESLGEVPEDFSEILEADKADYLAQKAQKVEQKRSRADKRMQQIGKFTRKIYFPSRSSEAEDCEKQSKKFSKDRSKDDK